MKKNIITVCTPTYNRAYILNRPYESLKRQTCKNFKWLIIDDGSKDGTEQLVNNFKKECNGFEIEYHKKENGGRHTALNCSYEFIDTEFVINLDSDDALLDDAIEKILAEIKTIKKLDNYEDIWQISFRCMDSETKEIVGDLYPDNINKLNRKKRAKVFKKIRGEKHNCRKTEILKQYPFPLYNGIKFVTENTVWDLIDRDYDSYYTNTPVSLYFQNMSDSFSSGNMHSEVLHESAYNYYVFVLNNLFDELFYNFNVVKAFPNVPKHAMLSKINYGKVMSDINKYYIRFFVTLCYPIAVLYLKICKRKIKR